MSSYYSTIPPITEDGRKIKVKITGEPIEAFVDILGTKLNKFFFISCPMIGGQLANVRDGETIKFTGFHLDTAYVFESRIEKYFYQPIHFLMMSWPHPQMIRQQVVRKSRRINTKLPCTVFPLTEPQTSGIITNLSVDGAAIRLLNTVKEFDDHIRLIFQCKIHDLAHIIECNAKVNKVEIDEASGKQLLRVSFNDDLQKWALMAYINEIIISVLALPIYTQNMDFSV
jgi:c-di-GMP-binding flagellar brake protein YcgR